MYHLHKISSVSISAIRGRNIFLPFGQRVCDKSLCFLCFPCDINLSSEEARDRESVEAWGARLVYSFEISLGPFENLFSFLQSPVLFVLSSSLRDGCKRFSVLFSRCAVLRFKSYAFARQKVCFCSPKPILLQSQSIAFANPFIQGTSE